MVIQKIKKAGSMGNIQLQIDTCYVTSPVRESKDERPYFPRVLIIAEQKSRQVVDFEMYQSITDDARVTLNKLMGMCLERGTPKEIQVRSEAMIAILDDFCKKTGIKLKMVKRLTIIEHLMEEMAYRF